MKTISGKKTFSAHQNYASSGIRSRLNACAARPIKTTSGASALDNTDWIDGVLE
jgi:hypothetical protein